MTQQHVLGGNKMKRKILSILLAGAMATTLLAGCGSGNNNAACD